MSSSPHAGLATPCASAPLGALPSGICPALGRHRVEIITAALAAGTTQRPRRARVATRLTDDDRSMLERIPCTTIERTLFDLCAAVSPTIVDLAIDRRCAGGLTTLYGSRRSRGGSRPEDAPGARSSTASWRAGRTRHPHRERAGATARPCASSSSRASRAAAAVRGPTTRDGTAVARCRPRVPALANRDRVRQRAGARRPSRTHTRQRTAKRRSLRAGLRAGHGDRRRSEGRARDSHP